MTHPQLSLVPAPAEAARPEPPTVDAELERRLHDTVLQTLELIARGGVDGRAEIEEILGLAAEAATELREIIDPSPARLAGTLADEVARAVARARRLSRVGIEFVVGPTDGTCSPPEVRAIAGAVAEALNNARKHSGATHIVVYLEELAGAAVCTVRDDGVGIGDGSADGIGISRSLVARMCDVDGDALIESSPGRGTKVTLAVQRRAA